MTFSFSVLEYLGKVAGGVLVLLSVVHEQEYYEATFFYNQNNYLLTMSEDFEERIGMQIQEHPDYTDIIKTIKSKVVPHEQIYNRLDDLNIDRWTKQ